MAKQLTAKQQNQLADRNVVKASGLQKILGFLQRAKGSKVQADTAAVMHTGQAKGLF